MYTVLYTRPNSAHVRYTHSLHCDTHLSHFITSGPWHALLQHTSDNSQYWKTSCLKPTKQIAPLAYGFWRKTDISQIKLNNTRAPCAYYVSTISIKCVRFIYIYIQSNRGTPLCNPFRVSVARILKCAPCSWHILCKLLASVRATENWGAYTSEDNLDWVMLIRDRFYIRMILRDPNQIDTHIHGAGKKRPTQSVLSR